tara:strand:- start:170 stop:856 length:687 start_codon:yes stop_codon:yes gene_type:complete
MRNYSFYPSIPGTNIGNMAMIQGNFMPSNPQFVGAGAYKGYGKPPTTVDSKGTVFQGNFMPSNPDFKGVGAKEIKPLGFFERLGLGFQVGGKAYKNIFQGKNPAAGTEEMIYKAERRAPGTISSNEKKEKPPVVTPEKEKDDKFNFERFMKDQRAFDQKLLNQAYIAGGMSDAGKSILEGSKVFGESIVPNMMAGTTGLLASMAQGNKAIAASFGVPISPMQRMGYYS